MPTFQRTETVDARQYLGGREEGLELALWVNSNGSAISELRAMWRPEFHLGGRTLPMNVRIQSRRYDKAAFLTDWIVQTQEGEFIIMSDNEFLEAGYKQV